MLHSHLFECVCFIKYDGIVFWQKTVAIVLLADHQIAKKKGVIYHQNLSFIQAPAGCVIMAF